MKANFKERSDVIAAAVIAMGTAKGGAAGTGGNGFSLFDFSAAKEGGCVCAVFPVSPWNVPQMPNPCPALP